MIRKLVAIVLSLLINFVVLAWLHAWSTVTVANAAPPRHADSLITLPTITVRPTAAQMRSLRHRVKPVGTSDTLPAGDGGIQTLVMPFYSFVDEPGAAGEG